MILLVAIPTFAVWVFFAVLFALIVHRMLP